MRDGEIIISEEKEKPTKMTFKKKGIFHNYSIVSDQIKLPTILKIIFRALYLL